MHVLPLRGPAPQAGLFARFVPLVAFSLTCLSVGCTTKAVGVNECRDVEEARCEASVPCGVITEEEVEDCKRFYRDHCLHGISGSETPSASDHKQCLSLIEEAGNSARDSLGMGGASEPDEQACAIVAAPWDYPECNYLVKDESSMGGGDSE